MGKEASVLIFSMVSNFIIAAFKIVLTFINEKVDVVGRVTGDNEYKALTED